MRRGEVIVKETESYEGEGCTQEERVDTWLTAWIRVWEVNKLLEEWDMARTFGKKGPVDLTNSVMQQGLSLSTPKV